MFVDGIVNSTKHKVDVNAILITLFLTINVSSFLQPAELTKNTTLCIKNVYVHHFTSTSQELAQISSKLNANRLKLGLMESAIESYLIKKRVLVPEGMWLSTKNVKK